MARAATAVAVGLAAVRVAVRVAGCLVAQAGRARWAGAAGAARAAAAPQQCLRRRRSSDRERKRPSTGKIGTRSLHLGRPRRASSWKMASRSTGCRRESARARRRAQMVDLCSFLELVDVRCACAGGKAAHDKAVPAAIFMDDAVDTWRGRQVEAHLACRRGRRGAWHGGWR